MGQVLDLRLNARVIAAGDVPSVTRETGLAAVAAVEAARLAAAADVVAVALERVGGREADRLARCLGDAGGAVARARAGGPDEADVLLVAGRDAFAALADRLRGESADLAAVGDAIAHAIAAHGRRRFDWVLGGGRRMALGPAPALVGVVNVTPDSFSDGGRWTDPAAAADHACRLADEGADLVDVGGESTRPGSDPVSEDDELARVMPVLERLAGRIGVPLSIDTRRPRVAREAVAAGAAVVNDVTGLQGDPDMAAAVAETGAAVVVMHMRGTPKTMQERPEYGNLMAEVCRHLRRGLHAARQAGVADDRVAVDPGIGFGKTLAHNLELLARLGQVRSLGRPILVGVSRKRFIGDLTGVQAPAARTFGTAAACALAVAAGAVLVRVHDVAEMRQAVQVAAAIAQAGESTA